ncbi:hypothetical protein GCM10017744_007080 [Streptomyces antimycoticus]|uniref:Lipoprotein n=1 Tax=Streptomyces antimycoticus TaxID=68175 RepID=A0A4D4KPJ1_9ACTN|nr:hypothetical protein [Streptomyces antimycoticus]GDY48408.1 hypothetical protein SANT12839_092900 [Streptomyces antimycoticus]
MKTARSKKTAAGWIAGVCVLLAAAPALTGCSTDSDSTKSKGQDGSASAAPTASTGADTEPTPSPKGRPGGQSTVQEAVATWVTGVVQDRPEKACLVMATAATGGSPAKPNTAAMCGGDTPEARRMKQQIHRLHASFAPAQSKNPPTVKVAKVPVAEKKATVDGEQITVDGQTLKAIVLSNSTGVKEDELGIRVEAAVMGGRWYVTDLGLSVG